MKALVYTGLKTLEYLDVPNPDLKEENLLFFG